MDIILFRTYVKKRVVSSIHLMLRCAQASFASVSARNQKMVTALSLKAPAVRSTYAWTEIIRWNMILNNSITFEI